MENEPVKGYRLCRCGCGNLVLDFLAYQTGGFALDCFLEDRGKKLREIEVINRGRRATVAIPGRERTDKRKYPGNRANAKKVERAKTKALKRLRMIFPDVYDVLYAEERHKAKLPPVFSAQANRLEQAVATNDIDVAYAAVTNPGAY